MNREIIGDLLDAMNGYTKMLKTTTKAEFEKEVLEFTGKCDEIIEDIKETTGI